MLRTWHLCYLVLLLLQYSLIFLAVYISYGASFSEAKPTPDTNVVVLILANYIALMQIFVLYNHTSTWLRWTSYQAGRRGTSALFDVWVRNDVMFPSSGLGMLYSSKVWRTIISCSFVVSTTVWRTRKVTGKMQVNNVWWTKLSTTVERCKVKMSDEHWHLLVCFKQSWTTKLTYEMQY